MSPWRKNIAVKLPLFWFRSETCRNFGHVTLTHWVFKSFLAGICVQNFFESASKYVVGYIEFQYCFCWSRKLYSSLNVTLTYFLDQSMKLHILRRNQDFCCWFLREDSKKASWLLLLILTSFKVVLTDLARSWFDLVCSWFWLASCWPLDFEL